MTSRSHLYRISFHNQGRVYEIYAKQVSHGGMPGFVEVEKLQFGERSALLVDPSEDKLKAEFENVERFYVPLHSVIRIDEVSKAGVARIREAGEAEKVTPMPFMSGVERPR